MIHTKARSVNMSERSPMMTSVAYVQRQLHHVLEERATVLARELGCIMRQRKFSGADLVQTLVFGFQQHPHASLEQLASTAQLRAVSVSDTAVHARFSQQSGHLLHGGLGESAARVGARGHPGA